MTERDSDEREPVSLLDGSDEPSDGVTASIQEALEVAESGEIDVSG